MGRDPMTDPFVRVDVWTLAEDDPIITAYADTVAAMMAKPISDPTSWGSTPVRRFRQELASFFPSGTSASITAGISCHGIVCSSTISNRSCARI
jgi:hypothetical protein